MQLYFDHNPQGVRFSESRESSQWYCRLAGSLHPDCEASLQETVQEYRRQFCSSATSSILDAGRFAQAYTTTTIFPLSESLEETF